METRRRLLLSATAVGAFAPAFARRAAAQITAGGQIPAFNIFLNTVLGVPSANAQALFDNGQNTGTAPAVISTNVDRFGGFSNTELNLNGNSATAFLSFYLNAVMWPIDVMPILVTKDATGSDIFRVELWPPNVTISYWDSLGKKSNVAFRNPALRVFSAGTVRGVFRYANFYFEIVRFWVGTWQLYRIFKNALGADPAVETVRLYHDLKGYSNPKASLMLPYIGDYNMGLSPLPVGWGVSGGQQADFHIGADPTQPQNFATALNGSLQQLTFDPNFPADPLWTQQIFVNNVGGFTRAPYSGAGVLRSNAPAPPIHLTGGGDTNFPGSGFGFNGGDTLYAPYGWSSYQDAPEDVGSPFD
jgi:hypothetical protein